MLEPRVLAIFDRNRRAVEPGQFDCEILPVGVGLILQKLQRHRFTQQDGIIRIAAPVDAGVNAVAERDVVRELVQLAVHR